MNSSTVKQALTSLASFFRRVTVSEETFSLEEMARLTVKLLNYTTSDKDDFTTFDGLCKIISDAIRTKTGNSNKLSLDEMRWELEYIFKDKVAVIVRDDYVFFEDLPKAMANTLSEETVHVIQNIVVNDASKTAFSERDWVCISGANVTLDGHGHTLTVSNTYTQMFFLINTESNNKTFTLKNLDIAYNVPSTHSSEQAVMRCGGSCNVNVENCTLNTTQLGVYSYYHSGNLSVRNSNVTSENAPAYRSWKYYPPNIDIINTTLHSAKDNGVRIDSNTGADSLVQIVLDDAIVQSDSVEAVCVQRINNATVSLQGNTLLHSGNAADIFAKNSIPITSETSYTGAPILYTVDNGVHNYLKYSLQSAYDTANSGVLRLLRDVCCRDVQSFGVTGAPTWTVHGDGYCISIDDSGATSSVFELTGGSLTLADVCVSIDTSLEAPCIRVLGTAELVLNSSKFETDCECIYGHYCSGNIEIEDSVLTSYRYAAIHLAHSESVVDIYNSTLKSTAAYYDENSYVCYLFSGSPKLNLRKDTIILGTSSDGSASADNGIRIGNNMPRPESYPIITMFENAVVNGNVDDIRFTVHTLEASRVLYYDDTYTGFEATRYDSYHEDGTSTTLYNF